MGSTNINDFNIEGYMNVFEMMVDDLVKENGGTDCSLAIENSKENNEEADLVVPTEISPVEISKRQSSNISSRSSSSLHEHDKECKHFHD